MDKKKIVDEIIKRNKKEFPWIFSNPLYKKEYIEKWVNIIFDDKLIESAEQKFENYIEQCCAMIVFCYRFGSQNKN